MTGHAKFTRDGARRIVAATLAYEGGNRDAPPIKFRPPGGDGDPIRIGKTIASWSKGTLADIEIRESGTPPAEEADDPPQMLEDVVNKFGDVPADRWVAVALAGNGHWYLIAAEC